MGKRQKRISKPVKVRLLRKGYVVHLNNCPLTKNAKLPEIHCYCFDSKKED